MEIPKNECVHIINILKQAKSALLKKDALKLKDLSNSTIHCASRYQDSGSITIAVIIYTFSKIIERDDYRRIKRWDLLIKKFNSYLDLAIKALKENKQERYEEYIQQARKTLESQAINLKPYIQSILKKASINKGSRIYEHGISMEQTAKLLGISQWELADYIGQRDHTDIKHSQTLNTKTRARIALEFFS